MIKPAIWEIGDARICLACQVAMSDEYVMRNMGEQRKDFCQRCGKEAPATFRYLYTMKGKVKERKGLL